MSATGSQHVMGAAGAMLLALVTLSGCGGVVGGVGAQSAINPGVYAPGSEPFGLPHSEWAARWYRWALAIPLAQNPLMDTTGDQASVGQSGPVSFLAGTAGDPPFAERSCRVPAGKAIFYPIINVFSASPTDGTTDDAIFRATDLITRYVSELETSVDGVPLERPVVLPIRDRLLRCYGAG